MPYCGAKDPKDASRSCILPSGHQTAEHMDRLSANWPNDAVREKMRLLQTQKTTKKRSQSRLNTVAAEYFASRNSVRTGPPLEAEHKWSKDAWKPYAQGVFVQYLKEHAEPFTTPEDIWPLVEKPQEMRAMVQVVKVMLKAGHMAEVDAKRLTGVYRTKDGYEFAMNKLVPIYQSLICTH